MLYLQPPAQRMHCRLRSEALCAAIIACAAVQVWGTLSCTLIVHPATVSVPAQAEAVERIISELRHALPNRESCYVCCASAAPQNSAQRM